MNVADAKMRLVAERECLSRAARSPEPSGWRPTPNLQEANLTAATGFPIMTKLWDLSPVDPWAFDASQPPSELPPPPLNAGLPDIVGTMQVGATLVVANGGWTPSTGLTYARQWLRDGVAIPAATAQIYVLVDDDLGAMISATVSATNAGGSASATSPEEGPVVGAPHIARRRNWRTVKRCSPPRRGRVRRGAEPVVRSYWSLWLCAMLASIDNNRGEKHDDSLH
jgi:hypothetical protein